MCYFNPPPPSPPPPSLLLSDRKILEKKDYGAPTLFLIRSVWDFVWKLYISKGPTTGLCVILEEIYDALKGLRVCDDQWTISVNF